MLFPFEIASNLQAPAFTSQQQKMQCSTNQAPEQTQGCCEPPKPSLAAEPPKHQRLSLSWASQEHSGEEEYSIFASQ